MIIGQIKKGQHVVADARAAGIPTYMQKSRFYSAEVKSVLELTRYPGRSRTGHYVDLMRQDGHEQRTEPNSIVAVFHDVADAHRLEATLNNIQGHFENIIEGIDKQRGDALQQAILEATSTVHLPPKDSEG